MRQGYVGAEFFSFSNNDNWLACSQALKKMSARWEFIDRTTDYGHTKDKSLILLRPQIQIPISKGLVLCRNNGWIMKNMDITKMGADSLAENTPNLPNLSAKAQKFWISMKKSLIGRL